jgi:hypothetical protein
MRQGDLVSMITFLIIAAMSDVVGSLGIGIAVIVNHGLIGYRTGLQ